MKVHSARLFAFSSLALLGACVGDAGPRGPLTINVAPLDLPNVDEIVYNLTVYNGDPDGTTAPDTVWNQDGLGTIQYGNSGGGDLTYIGTCDADSDQNNYVELELVSIKAGGVSLTDQNSKYDDDNDVNTPEIPVPNPDFQNPAPVDDGLLLDFPCEENKDVLVEFNITVMRSAKQGFFDVAVNFEDVFCSAKADSCYAAVGGGAPTQIRQLFGEDDGIHDAIGRDHTMIVGLACTAGPDHISTQNRPVLPETELLMTRPHVSCTNSGNVAVNFYIPLVGDGGEDVVLDSDGSGAQLAYGIYHDAEELNCGEANGVQLSCNKAFFNFAIDIDNLVSQGLKDCNLEYWASAQDATKRVFSEISGIFMDPHGVYGAVHFNAVPLTTSTATAVCDAHPLNGKTFGNADSKVRSVYVAGSDYSNSTQPLPTYTALNGGPATVIPATP